MPDGWRSIERRRDDGAIDSIQLVPVAAPVVDSTAAGALRLGRGYWLEVQRTSHGLVRPRERGGAVELRLLALGPPLLTFGAAQTSLGGPTVGCSYPIWGGVLARQPGGTVSLLQLAGASPELRVAVEGYFPRLRLLGPLQRRFHVHVSRRYLRRMLAGAPR